jgi:hypothetical protein
MDMDMPEDVMKLAQAAFADTKVISASLVAEDEDSDVLPYIINRAARAILAEREACAKIAEEHQVAIAGKPSDYTNGFNAAAEIIARAIRSPSLKEQEEGN